MNEPAVTAGSGSTQSSLHGWTDWRTSSDASGAEENALSEHVLALSSILIALLATVWVATYFALGLVNAAIIPLSYQVLTVIGLALWRRTGRFRDFRTFQLCIMLLLPFLLQWTLGGFVAGSAVSLWALATPLGAFLFGARPWPWVGAYVMLMVCSGVLEPFLDAAPIASGVQTAFFVLNLGTTSVTVLVLLWYFLRQRDVAREALAREHAKLRTERARSEALLLNILPPAVADRLKEGERTIADRSEVTVVFADIVAFTPMSSRTVPEQVVALLNDVFTALDQLADKHGLEKIKTIGDAYMAVSGLPEARGDHTEVAAEFALGVLATVRRFTDDQGDTLDVRIGMDRGPAVAGVIGQRKFSYDLWGATVNTASRMESFGVPGRIQVTQRVVEQLADRYDFDARGDVDVKGIGSIPTWFLTGRSEHTDSASSE